MTQLFLGLGLRCAALRLLGFFRAWFSDTVTFVLIIMIYYVINSYSATSRMSCKQYSFSEQLEHTLTKEVIKVCVMNRNFHAGRGTLRHAHFNFTEA